KGDSLADEYVSELWDFTRINVTQNNLQELKEIWDQWNDEVRQLFYNNYGDLPYLLVVKTVYSRAINVPTFLKKLMNITGMSEHWVAARIKQKGDSKCIPWKSLKDLILTHINVRKRVDVFALSIYGLVVFPKALRHVDESVTDLFDQFDKRVTPIPTILAKTFRSLSACRKAVATPRRDDILEEKWMAILQNLQEEDIKWRAPWLLLDEILYRCGDFDLVPLLGIWGAVGYVPLLVLRQYRSRQFIPTTQGIADSEFSYRDDGYRKKIQEISSTWKETH
ncbi:hypothetical protein Golax_022940, partial [Gossypium laxum]|nr:hypothetical protein [Gossypium laxum]